MITLANWGLGVGAALLILGAFVLGEQIGRRGQKR